LRDLEQKQRAKKKQKWFCLVRLRIMSQRAFRGKNGVSKNSWIRGSIRGL